MQPRSALRLASLVLCSAALLAACADLPTPVVDGPLQPGAPRLTLTPPTNAFATIDGGQTHSCALTSSGIAWCWGRNSFGQLGDSSSAVRSVAVEVRHPRGAPSCEFVGDEIICTVGNPVPFTRIAVGDFHSCALTSAGQAYCWGSNADGRLGDSTNTNQRKPAAVKQGALAFTEITAGDNHTCALTSAGAAYCWGYNLYGQLGDSTTTFRKVPTAVRMPSGVTFTSISAGQIFTCALTSGGQAYCWGYGGNGQTGDNSIFGEIVPSPVAQPSGVTFVSVTAGYEHACGVTSGGQAYCWGSNGAGQLGNGTNTDSPTPVAVSQPSGVTFASVSAGTQSCARTSAGQAYCWGANGAGQLGDGTTTASNVPVAVSQPSGVTFAKAFTAAGNFSCGLDGTDGRAYCWGANNFNQLGNGTTTGQTTPGPVTH